LKANFEILTYNITLNATQGGSVSGGGQKNCGTNNSISATASAGYTFKN
jgi:hypothetical protein